MIWYLILVFSAGWVNGGIAVERIDSSYPDKETCLAAGADAAASYTGGHETFVAYTCVHK